MPCAGLLRDLIERRLWPVAVLLLAAAVAVPIYLGRSSAQDTAATAPAAGAAGGCRQGVQGGRDPRGPGGRRRPRRQRAQPLQAAARAQGRRHVKPAQTPAASSGGHAPELRRRGRDRQRRLAAAGHRLGWLRRLRRLRRAARQARRRQPATDPLDAYHLTLRFGHARGDLKTLHGRRAPLAAAHGRQPLLRLHRGPQGRQDRGLPALLRRHGDRRRPLPARAPRPARRSRSRKATPSSST